jgi:hypothetical protein
VVGNKTEAFPGETERLRILLVFPDIRMEPFGKAGAFLLDEITQ